MGQIRIELENCYGIKKLSHEFDFSARKAYAIYAPNGSMKSSLAQTFKDIAEGKKSQDRIFPDRITVRKVTDETGADLPQESVLVLPPYDELFGNNEQVSTLLLNAKLKKEFQQLHADIDKSKTAFLKKMKEQSGSKRDLESEIALTFTKADDDNAFYQALERIEKELAEQKDAPFAKVDYDVLFDEKVLPVLGTKDFKLAIAEYVNRYNALLSMSTYFKKGVFEYYNASQIAKTLADNGFFKAKHTITLNANEKLEIGTQKELEEFVKKELDNITQDKELKKTFGEVKKVLEKNAPVRDFHAYICNNEFLLPHLSNVDLLKERIWKSYFKSHEDDYRGLLEQFRRVKARRREIEEEASKEITLWETAIDLFNDRFFVPFRLEAKNKAAVTLGHEAILDLTYTFKDGAESTPIGRDTLLKSLSQGEKKALYILNIIFEIEVRRQNKQETLFVVDDIADSFDYKNKYAIIQYLMDISEGAVFKQVILTHNFDFFRTINSRFVGYSGCLMATKEPGKIILAQAAGIGNVFVNDWKAGYFTNNKKKIACIPFMRNLIEFTRGDKAPEYDRLTSLLHWKSESGTITVGELDGIYQRLFVTSAGSPNPTVKVVDLIKQEAVNCLTTGGGANFEHKIVLSIAIRLSAEMYMANKIADAAFMAAIKENQTYALLKEFEKRFPTEIITIKKLKMVQLMTPENIHLNAFMYEPILDMSDDHLKKLYTDVSALK
jgi:hypothetical protein